MAFGFVPVGMSGCISRCGVVVTPPAELVLTGSVAVCDMGMAGEGIGTSSEGRDTGTGMDISVLVFLLGAYASSSTMLGFNGQIPVFQNAQCLILLTSSLQIDDQQCMLLCRSSTTAALAGSVVISLPFFGKI